MANVSVSATIDSLLKAANAAAAREVLGISGGLNKFDATAAPTTGDDTADGYAVGSLWIDLTNDEAYRCLDATAGAAVWVKTTLDPTEATALINSMIGTATQAALDGKQAQVISGTPVNAVAASGSITYGSPNNSDTVAVAGTTFTKVASAPTGNQFSNIAELTALIEALATVNATSNGTVITVTAATKGAAGNAITLALGGGNGGTMAVSGATLAGGVDGTVASAAYSVIYADGEKLWVPIAANTVADANWRFAPIADVDGAIAATIAPEDVEDAVLDIGQIGIVGNSLRIGNGGTHGLAVRPGNRAVTVLSSHNDAWHKVGEVIIPAAWMFDGANLLLSARIFQSHGWTNAAFSLYFKTDASAADPNSAAVEAAKSSFLTWSATALALHELESTFNLASGFGTGIAGVRRTSTAAGQLLGAAAMSFLSVTHDQKAAVQLYFFDETTSAPSGPVTIDATLDIVPLG